jgi:hypothetical protein
MLSVESAPRPNGKHVSFAIDSSSVENSVYTEVSKTSFETSNFPKLSCPKSLKCRTDYETVKIFYGTSGVEW